MSDSSCIPYILRKGAKIATTQDIENRKKNPSYEVPDREIVTADAIGVVFKDGADYMFLPYSSIHMILVPQEG